MIPCVFHPVAPAHLPVLEKEFPADLPVVAASKGASSGFEALIDGADHRRGHGVLHIFGAFRTEAQGPNHAELGVELFGWVGVDGVRTLSLLYVHWDKIGLTASDDDDLGWSRESLKGIGGYGGRKATKVFLTVLSKGSVKAVQTQSWTQALR